MSALSPLGPLPNAEEEARPQGKSILAANRKKFHAWYASQPLIQKKELHSWLITGCLNPQSITAVLLLLSARFLPVMMGNVSEESGAPFHSKSEYMAPGQSWRWQTVTSTLKETWWQDFGMSSEHDLAKYVELGKLPFILGLIVARNERPWNHNEPKPQASIGQQES